jgi:hypothetical protein
MHAKLLKNLPTFVTGVIDERANLLGDGLSGTENAGTDSANWTIHGFCNVFVTQTLNLSERHSRPKFRGQGLNGTVHGFCDLPGHEDRVGRLDVCYGLIRSKWFPIVVII